MRAEKFTNQLQQAFAEAQSIAIGNDHSAIEVAHLFVALLNQQGGSVRPILNRAGFDVSGLQQQLNQQLDQLAKVKSPTGDVNISQELGRLMNLADRAAQKK
jgi:ATP-dependent Clp protease ATP-binding subunit ClpB